MNLLIENAPDYIMVRGIKIPIKTDFQVWVRFIIASEDNNMENIKNSLIEIFGGIPSSDIYDEISNSIFEWLTGIKNRNKIKKNGSSNNKIIFDFKADGNIIYCELWQYFPELMKKGISYHEGMELIKILLNNEDTVLWHRAYARGGDFSKLDKEQKKYWQKERAKYTIKSNEKQSELSIDNVFSNAFK